MGQSHLVRIAAGLRFAGAPLLVLAPLVGAGPAAAQAPPDPGQDPRPAAQGEPDPATAEIQRVLRRARDPKAPPAAEAALELAPVAREGLPLLVEILHARRVPALGEERAQTLSEVQESIVMHTLAGLERATVLAQTQNMLSRGRTAEAREAAVRILGAVGRALDVPTLYELVHTAPGVPLERRVEEAFRSAVGSLVRRDGDALLQFDRLWSYQPEALLQPLLEGLGDGGDARCLELLDEILVRHDRLLVPVLTEIRRVGPSRSLDVNDRLAARLRHHIEPSRPACRPALFALATLRDYDSVPALIDLLGHESRGLASDAYFALRELTGLDLRADAELWNAWYESELDWIAEQAPRVLAKLHSPRHADIAAAIGELAKRRLFNDTWALELAPLLDHSAPSLRLLTARALAALRSPYVVAGLIEALLDPSSEVRDASHRALRATTRLDLPPDAVLWRGRLLDTRT